MSADDMPRKTIALLVIASVVVLIFALGLNYPTNAELSAGRLTTYYAWLALGLALLFGALVELRFAQLRAEIRQLQRRLDGDTKPS
ncbi:MAG: hypothetical protein OK452_04250 [Thaumarchaeota archaeon]|nr:hypothetical protein [Nitrososphaerota archaeon]